MRLPRCLVLWLLLGVLISSSSPAYAYPPPIGAGDAFYVEERWADQVDFNGRTVVRAYQIGFNADVAGPYPGLVILAFGRQVDTLPEGWGVNLPRPDQGNHTEAWVEEIAWAFMQGYHDNPNHTVPAIVGLTTSNGTYNWTCDNQSAATLSPKWRRAGERWGALVERLRVRREAASLYLWVESANDIESWQGEFTDGWTACGRGTIAWLEGYASTATYDTGEGDWTTPNNNIGSNAYVENDAQWTQEQLYAVSYGLRATAVYPQIYCPTQVQGWFDMVVEYDLNFYGVTSENAFSTLCNNGTTSTYTWQQSWRALSIPLEDANLDYHLGSEVASFYYP